MKNYKRITSLAIASLMVASASLGFAAPKDVYNQDKSVYKTSNQMAVSDISQRKVSLKPNSYLFEGNNGKLYTVAQAQKAFSEAGQNFLANLEANYIPVGDVNESLTVDTITALNKNTISVKFKGIELPVTIALDQALNHGQNLVTFTYKGQTFDGLVTYVDEEVKEKEEAIDAANKAIDELDKINLEDVTLENKNQIAEQIGGARALIAKAKELDEFVVFDTYPLEQLEKKIAGLNKEVDAVVAAANKAIAELPAVEDVNFENKEAVSAQISEARALVVKAMTIDKNVVFNMYQIEQLEAKLERLKDLKVEDIEVVNNNTLLVKFEGINERVEIVLDEALNHGQNLRTFTYKGQTFEVMVTYVDKNVVKVEEAIKAAEEAVESLNDFGEVTYENKAQAIKAIVDVEALIEKANELDANVVFDRYPIKQLQAKIDKVNEQIDAKVAEANAAIDELDKIDIETVTIADRTELIEKVANARALIAEAQEMDSNVSFNTYAIEQVEAKITDFNTEIDAKVAEAQAAIDALDAYEKATNANKTEIQEKINAANELIAEAKEMDSAVSFNTYQLDKLQAEIDALDVNQNKLKAVNDAKTPYDFNKALKAAGIENVNSNEAVLNKYNTAVVFESLEEVQAKVDLINSLEGNVLTGTPVEINETIRGDIEIKHTGDLRLNGNTIDGNVTINTTKVGTINLESGTIKGNLDITVPNGTTINNSATIKGTVTINGAAQGFSFRTMLARTATGIVWNEKADGNKIVNKAEDAVITIAEGKKVESLELEVPTTLKVEKGVSFETPVVVKANSTIVSEEAVPAKIDNEVKVTVKTDEKDEGVEVEGTDSEDPVDVTLAAAEKLVSEYEAAVKDEAAVVGLVNNDTLRNKVSALKTPAFNKVQLVKGEEKQVLLDKLDVAHDKLIAATAVKGLQNATKNITLENLDNAKIKLSNAKTNVKKLADGEIKTALNELVTLEETQITNLEAAIAAVEKAEETKTQVDADAAQDAVDTLVGSQAKIALQAKIDAVQAEINQVLADAIKAAEEAIADLPTVEHVKISDKDLVQTAKDAVAAVLALDEDVTIEGSEVIAELDKKIAQLEEVADAKTAKNAEIENVVLTQEEKAGKTAASIEAAEAKLTELKNAAKTAVEATTIVEDVNAISVDKTKATSLLVDQKITAVNPIISGTNSNTLKLGLTSTVEDLVVTADQFKTALRFQMRNVARIGEDLVVYTNEKAIVGVLSAEGNWTPATEESFNYTLPEGASLVEDKNLTLAEVQAYVDGRFIAENESASVNSEMTVIVSEAGNVEVTFPSDFINYVPKEDGNAMNSEGYNVTAHLNYSTLFGEKYDGNESYSFKIKSYLKTQLEKGNVLEELK